MTSAERDWELAMNSSNTKKNNINKYFFLGHFFAYRFHMKKSSESH
jgi:hypothetical protein